MTTDKQKRTTEKTAFDFLQRPAMLRAVLLGRVALVAQRPIVVKLSRERSVGLSVRACVLASVCPVHCGKTADRIRMPFGIIGRTGPGMRQIVGFGDRSTRRGTFQGEFGAPHCITNGEFTAYVCDSAATRRSSQIILGRLVRYTISVRPSHAGIVSIRMNL